MKYLKAALALALLLIFTASGAAERVEDNFEDGDYTSDPAWSVSGSSTVQVVNDGADGSTYALEIQNGNGDTTVHYDRGTSHDVDGHTYGYWLRPTTSGEQVRVGLSNSVADNIYDAEDAVWIRTWSDKQAQLVSNDGTSWGASKSSLGPSNPGTDYYYFTIAFDTVNSEATAKMYDTSMNQVGSATVPMYGPDYLQYAWMSSSTGTLHTDDADYSLQSQNKNPHFNSTNVDPDPPLIDNPVSYNASTSDPDGSIQETCLKVNWKGSQVYQSCKASSTPTWPDVYKPSSTGWLNATLNTTNEQGNTTSTEINRLLSTTRNFTTCGATGRYGPSQIQCNSAYQGTNLESEVKIVGEGIQEWEVPRDGNYRITAVGAEGAGSDGGNGAKIVGDVHLSESTNISILVGQKGIQGSIYGRRSGGGGGTFVVNTSNYQGAEVSDILAVGGGGGGAGYEGSPDGQAGRISREGGSSTNSGGVNGYGGNAGDDTYDSGAGAGFRGNGDYNAPNGCLDTQGCGGNAFINGGEGGRGRYDGGSVSNAAHGGFGGGGGADTGGGGGGGFSGGGAAENNYGAGEEGRAEGGGGGSYIGIESLENISGFNEGQGYVEIELINTTDSSDFCNYRGPFNECVMNQTNQLDQDAYNVSSFFEARESAVFEALNGRAEINVFNSSSISGSWRGAFNINAQSPRLEAGARFRPENGRIKIGN